MVLSWKRKRDSGRGEVDWDVKLKKGLVCTMN